MKVSVGLSILVLLFTSQLAFLQALQNSSEVSVSSLTDSQLLLNATTITPTEVLKAGEEDFPPNCPLKVSCRKGCDNETFQGDDIDGDAAHCHCDQDCLTFQDCCADFTNLCERKPVNPVIPAGLNYNYSCVILSTEFGQKKGVYMITTCAANWNGSEEVRTKCLAGLKSSNRSFTSKNIMEDIPVASLNRNDSTQYRNIYCGICNNEPAVDLPSWQLKFRCNIRAPPSYYNDEEKLNFFLKYCPTRILRPNKYFKIRTCLPMISTCSLANEHQDGCINGKSGVFFSQTQVKNYKNIHCLLCNGISLNTSQCGPEEKGDLFNPKSFEIIMDFNQIEGKDQKIREPKLSSIETTCPTNKVFDPHLETCETGSDVNPSKLFQTVHDSYRVKLWMHPSDESEWPVSSEEFHHAVCSSFAVDPSQIDVISITKEDSSTAVNFNLYAGSLKTGKTNVSHETLNVSVILNFTKSFPIEILNKTWMVLRITHRQLSCAQPEEFTPGEFLLLPSGKALVNGIGNKTAELLPQNKFFIKHNNNSNDSLVVCRSKFIVLCPFKLLLVSGLEYRILANDNLLHNSTGRQYTKEEYHVVDELRKAWICTNYTATPYTSAIPYTTAILYTTAIPNPKTKTYLKSTTCPLKFSCRKGCDNEIFQGDDIDGDAAHCHCDQDCLTFQDCCADFTNLCEPKPLNPANPPGWNYNYSCVILSTEFGQKKGVYMITTCAANWNGSEEVRTKCLAGLKSSNRSFTSKNIMEDIPVDSLIRNDGTQYRNIYCGICNNEPAVVLPSWQLKFRCNIRAPPSYYNDEEKLNFFLKYCPTRILRPNEYFKIRTCLPMISTCSLANEHQDGCINGKSGVVFSQTQVRNYKNIHCLLCNGISLDTSQCGPEEKGDLFNPKSFEIIMDFNQIEGKDQKIREPKLSSIETTCPTNKVFDPHLETCETGSDVNPSKLFQAVHDSYRVKLWMHPSDESEWAVSSEEFHQAVCSSFAVDPSQIDVISIAKEDSSTAVNFNLYAGSLKTAKNNVPYETLNVSVILNFSKTFPLVIAHKTWIILRITHRQLSCAQPEEFASGEFLLNPTGQALVNGSGNKTAELLPQNKFFIKHNNNSNHSLVVCRSTFTVLCPFKLLLVSGSEYRIVANDNLLHTSTGRQYTKEEYHVVDELRKAWICTDCTAIPCSKSTFLRYFTIVGFSLSICALVLTLLIHCIFNELRGTLPGKNLMSLCLALLLAQFMWLFGSGDTDKPTFCSVIAAIIHYLVLVSFACTAVIAFDTRRTFSSQISKAPSRSLGQSRNLRFLSYSCLAWGVPLLFVIGCVLLDHLHVVFIGYGNQDACWLVNINAKIVIFATPIACVLLYNVVAFSHTLWAINNARKQTRRAKSSRQDQRAVLKIFVRLISLMGFTWFFSFSAELIHKVLVYPFVILTTLQGIYIFVAFICKARVLKLMKERFSRSKKDALASIQHTASTECRSLPPYSPYRSQRETPM